MVEVPTRSPGRPPRPLIDRFLEKVAAESTGCWEWMASTAQGYGQIHQNGIGLKAHRVAYEFFVGSIAEGLQIDHLCRNKTCVNPTHLEPVTPKENQSRNPNSPTTINANKTHCIHGHPLDRVDERTGRRYCDICKKAASRRSYLKRRPW